MVNFRFQSYFSIFRKSVRSFELVDIFIYYNNNFFNPL